MSVDPKGTTPGVQAEPAKPQTVNMRCGKDPCQSIEFIEIIVEGSVGQRIYRCVKCNNTRALNVGGYLNV